MAVTISVDVDDAAAQKRLSDMERRSRDFSRVLAFGGEMLEDFNAENFLSNGLPVGGWAPRKGRYAWPPLRRTTDLFTSLTNLVGPPNEIGPMSARFGTAVPYAKFHQYGTRVMARRKIVFEPYGFAEELGDAAGSHVVRGTLFGR